MKHRILSSSIRRALRTFPAVVLTGPRQSGKTTLLKHLLRTTHAYATLEDPDTLVRARADLKEYVVSAGLISCAPDIFPVTHGILNYPWQDLLAC